MNTGISPGAKWFTLCLPFFQYLFFHCKFTISISVSVCRCKSKVQFRFAAANLRWCKDSASREERKELAQFSFPRRRLSYSKIVQGKRKETNLFDFALPNRRLSYSKIVQGERKEKSPVQYRTLSQIGQLITCPTFWGHFSGMSPLYAMKDDSSPISKLIYVGICRTVDDDFVRVSA